MTKYILVVLFICVFVLTLGCENQENTDCLQNIPLDSSGEYLGFSDVPDLIYYSVEDAKEDGCFVIYHTEVLENYNVWENFVNKSIKKENSYIRIVYPSLDKNSAESVLDLYYLDGHYYLFDFNAQDKNSELYSHLLILSANSDNPNIGQRFIVLSNDKSLTFETLKNKIYSSKAEFSDSIESAKAKKNYRIIMWDLKQN